MNKELIIERYKNPKFLGSINSSITGRAINASCGDEVSIQLKAENDIVTDAKFLGSGCSICLACADIVCEKSIGMKLSEVSKITTDSVCSVIGMDSDSPRIRCASLSIEAVKEALKVVI